MTDGDVSDRDSPVPQFLPTGVLVPSERSTQYELEDLVPRVTELFFKESIAPGRPRAEVER
eukprot:656523-Lingulodinium_polyedra.AAC.1